MEMWTNKECEDDESITDILYPFSNRRNMYYSTSTTTFFSIEEICTTQHLPQRLTAEVKNYYSIVQVSQRKNQLFKTSNTAIEDCNGLFSYHQIKGANLIPSPCRLFIKQLKLYEYHSNV